jgi:AcrR family transcriptional regulator
MPKIVDHQLRRRDIGEALWRVVEREGMQGVSVRTVAAEAGVSPGSLRYYFSSQVELIMFAVELLVERVTNRILGRVRIIDTGEDPVDWLTDLLKEGLPLDKTRIDEMSVWSTFVEQSRINPLLEPARRMEWSVSQWLCRTAVVNLLDLAIETSADTPLEETLEAEALLLHTVWDGLVIQLSLYPEPVRAELADRLLRLHLEGIRARGTSGGC